MLDIYPFILETVTALRPVTGRIARADADLGRQLRRAQTSIALNVAEGAYSRGRNRQARYHTALGSARETLACVEIAVALGHLDALDDELARRFHRIIGTLVRLSGVR
jgi:four helix bundle protein